jgi:hypothetical protein
MNHPIQPIEKDEHGVLRFKPNTIVDFLAKDRLNELAAMDFPREDWEQLAQLIGYSLSGFGDLSYVKDFTYNTAEAMARQGMTEEQARITDLERTLEMVRAGLKGIIPELFRIHPDDIHE